MPYATYRFNKIIAAETIRFIVTVAIVVYKGLKLVVYRMLTMNRLKDGIREKVNTVKMLAVFCAGVLSIGMTACDDGLDVTQAYPFTVETMPVQTKIVKGETAEIRCELKREGRYDGARYTIRYFQPDGKGTLRMDDGTVFLPNDRYSLEREVFRLYYTSASTDQQTIDIYVEDNFGQVVQLTFDFNNENEEKEEVQE